MKRPRGFTLIELLVVMAIMATLLAIAAPRFFDSRDRAREAALRADLRVFREAIDHFKADTGRYPRDLQELVSARYIRALPPDPITDKDSTWVPVPVPDGRTPGLYDIHSGAVGNARDGTAYSSW